MERWGCFLKKHPHTPAKTFEKLVYLKLAGKRLQYEVLRRAAPPLQEKTPKMNELIFGVFSLAEPFAFDSFVRLKFFGSAEDFFSKKSSASFSPVKPKFDAHVIIPP